ncbi:MAG: aldose 1-epimerase family protein [Clostridia bacterium]|nr:aldose 1-epimerase family protein [Clostridia bacterium]
MNNKYIGHASQIYGVEEVRLVGTKGDGMRILNVKNAKGLCFSVSADRAADISRISFKGDNYGYFAPCGYVSPAYFDDKGEGFLKSFTAGFMTTCGLTAVGDPCTDNGEDLPLHGTISHIPAENIYHYIEDDKIHIKAVVKDAALFSHQLVLEREYICPIYENVIQMIDKIKNVGAKETPFEILYHCNIGYPLLSENAKVKIPASKVLPRNEHAASDILNCLKMHEPQADYEEMCFYHEMSGETTVSIFNPDIKKGLNMHYDADSLKCFTEWKMLGEYDYVLGLEPGNCYPDGRDVMREKGILEFLKPGEERNYKITFEFTESEN